MDIVYGLLPAAIPLAVIAAAGFVWAVRRGQYDDLDTPQLRMLVDDEKKD